MTNKFPGSWWKVLVLCLAIMAGKAVRVALLQPTMASWVPSPVTSRLVMRSQDPHGPNIVVGSATEALALVAGYEDSFTPELDTRARELAEMRGMNGARLSTVRSMFLVMAGNDLLLKPDVLLDNLPADYEVVCGDQPPDYVCMMLAVHVNSVAQGYAESRESRQQQRSRDR